MKHVTELNKINQENSQEISIMLKKPDYVKNCTVTSRGLNSSGSEDNNKSHSPLAHPYSQRYSHLTVIKCPHAALT
jgi:hypothetical protein